MKKSAIHIDPGYFSRYINLAGDTGINETLAEGLEELEQLDLEALERVGDKTYAPGKWTLKDIFQHMSDTERVFQYRALRFARNDSTVLPGFEQDLFAAEARAVRRTLDDLIRELLIVRQSSICFFRDLEEETLQRTGIASGNRLSVLAIGFVIAGHQVHHLNIIREKYLTLPG
ncbi:MAG TPA: DinB family protein [Anseongella sp.]|nr:DinB family protein [Anseongella sp.]